MPQVRKRAYLISVYVGKDELLKKKLEKYFNDHDLQNIRKPQKHLAEFLRTDYSDATIKEEADGSQPNDTPSRRNIFDKNVKLFNNGVYSDFVPTITTKQDRHPNAGVVTYSSGRPGKSNFRYLTGRECMLLMGFDDKDYEAIMTGNFMKSTTERFFSNTKIVKLAGNSIVVPVLEDVFTQLVDIDEKFLQKTLAETSSALNGLAFNELSLAA